jgi:transposase
MDTLEQFIHNNPQPKELKRALAVQMSQRGHGYREIRDVLQVSIGFISHCNQRYDEQGVAGLKSNYHGTQGYLSKDQKQKLFAWLQTQDYWTIEELVEHLEDTYGVSYKSQQSYYALLHEAGFSWKKSQPAHPDRDEAQVQEKKRNYGFTRAVALRNCQWASAGNVFG